MRVRQLQYYSKVSYFKEAIQYYSSLIMRMNTEKGFVEMASILVNVIHDLIARRGAINFSLRTHLYD